MIIQNVRSEALESATFVSACWSAYRVNLGAHPPSNVAFNLRVGTVHYYTPQGMFLHETCSEVHGVAAYVVSYGTEQYAAILRLKDQTLSPGFSLPRLPREWFPGTPALEPTHLRSAYQAPPLSSPPLPPLRAPSPPSGVPPKGPLPPVGFPNQGNTCYMDVIFFALFATPKPNMYLNAKLFHEEAVTQRRAGVPFCQTIAKSERVRKEVRTILRDIERHIRNYTFPEYCTQWKNLIRECDQENQWETLYTSGAQADAGEQLQWIAGLFISTT